MGVTSARLDDELNRDVQATATREGVSVSEFVRAAVHERAERILSGVPLWERIQPILEELERADLAERVPIPSPTPSMTPTLPPWPRNMNDSSEGSVRTKRDTADDGALIALTNRHDRHFTGHTSHSPPRPRASS